MYPERYRSHHDAENRLAAALGLEAHSRRALVDTAALEAELGKAATPVRRGIYIHVPYCDRICSFCNLNRKERSEADLDAYVQLVKQQIDYYAGFPLSSGRPYDAVYFGGGTPTVLSAAQLSALLDHLRARLSLRSDCEITVESTIHNLSMAKLVGLEQAGVNRFSIGVQTFVNRGRRLLGRSLDGVEVAARLAAIRDKFSGCLAVDIIYDYPGQTLQELDEDTIQCSRLQPDSISYYPLMIHAGSTLGQDISNGRMHFSRQIERERSLHQHFYATMRANGYGLLEFSKLARAGRDEYRYIRIRYANGDLLPLGVGAGGNLGNCRIYNMAPQHSVASWIDDGWQRWHAALGQLQFGVFNSAALASSLVGDRASATAALLEQVLESSLADKASQGLLVPLECEAAQYSSQYAAGGWQLTADGVFWGNNIAVELLETAVRTINTAKEEIHA